MFSIDMISRIFSTMERGMDFGLDVRLLRELIDEANRRLEEIGVRLKVNTVGTGTVLKDKTVVTDANASVLFFSADGGCAEIPEQLKGSIDRLGDYSVFFSHRPGIDAAELHSVLEKMSSILDGMGIGINFSMAAAMLSESDGKMKVMSMDTSITFKKKEA